MRLHYLKKLILGLVVVLIGCDVTLLFAAQATAANNSAESTPNTPPAAPTLPAAASQPVSAPQAQQLQQLQALQQAAQTQSARIAQPNNPQAQQPATSTMNPANPANSPAGAPLPQPAPLPGQNSANGTAAKGVLGMEAYYQSPAVEDAFNSVAQNALPMSPEQVQRLRQLFNSSQLAASAAGGVPPKPIASSQIVHLDPGSTPPVIRLGQGFVSSLVFLDSSGAPWPIEAYDVGNPSAFNIQWNRTDNMLLIQSNSLYTYGNLAIRLKGLNTPVMLTLIPGQKAIDYRVDLRIQGAGPNSTALPTGDNLPASASPQLLSVLDGIPPAGSKAVKVQGGACQAWLANNKLYVRTRLTILSPAWLATMSSADGMKAYEMQKSPMLLVSQDGKVAQLKVEGF